ATRTTPTIQRRVRGGAANRTMPRTTSAAAIPVRRMGGLLTSVFDAIVCAEEREHYVRQLVPIDDMHHFPILSSLMICAIVPCPSCLTLLGPRWSPTRRP